MQFSTTLILAAVAALASAQNPFTFTSLTSITAGTPFNITWAPSTGTTDTVSLVLRQGESTALDTIETIASKIQNTGSYLWTPPTTLVNGAGYAFQIIDDGNTDIVNYSNQFSISSTNTVTPVRSSTASSASASASGSTSASASSGATTTTSGSSAASTSGSSSGSATTSGSSRTSTGTATTASAASGTQSATSSPTGNLNGAGSLKVGGGMLAVLGAVMALL
ncbi:Ser-Thr-rich glycosyl-phosphatidyl-inositol-anchored membrane family-domain-containing protein [Leptodontidium sp. 2 PMI_412]|nr:Ser-Thr-rich glycosyl-phosphatidyl-inositol-anchored membrane family-domain-containing protein [Leptodontidium sp. 2 PMI_412]